jgi:hypothetical protein
MNGTKSRIALLTLLAFLTNMTLAQSTPYNCGTATQKLTSTQKNCASTTPGTYAPYTEGFTYAETTYNNSGTQTGSTNSTVTGTGECENLGASPPNICPPENFAYIDWGTAPGQDNEFINEAWDTEIQGGGIFNPTINCKETGPWTENDQFLPATYCTPGGGGEGGGTQPCDCECDAPDLTSGGGGGGTAPSCGSTGCCVSPIVIDTLGTGFHLTSPAAGVMFDIRSNGHPVQMAWTAADSGNAFLALDRNHNGKIDNGGELFGNLTAQPVSANPNGYLALADFDANHDGIIDWRDPVYKDLLLWVDSNHDGISQPSELFHLWELGVYSISLKYREEPYVDQFGNGFRYRSVLNPREQDGESKDGRYTYDVFFHLLRPAGATGACPKKAKVQMAVKIE